MEVSSLDLPAKAKEALLGSGITKLNPPQQLAVKAGLLNYRNLVVASPTASGKTLIAELAFLKTVLEKGKKAVYILPLRALASEKYEDFKRYEGLGLRVGISVGDLDSADAWLAKYDLIIATSEKLDSLLRHGPEWIKDVGLIIVDEIHLLNDENRGPTLEILLTRLKVLNAQILGLSATIANAEEIADWLGADLVRSDYRPVRLHQGVYDGKAVRFQESDRDYELPDGDSGELLLAEETVKNGKQSLVFASSRRNAESIAEKAGEVVAKFIKDKSGLEAVASRILSAVSVPTKQCKRLAECVRHGTAFHHAGLTNEQRRAVEEAFKNNTIKLIAATPTLAAGMNLPAYRVLIRDVKRFHPVMGSDYIPVLEYQQMAGRAGRPRYDKEGESVLIAKSSGEARELAERYILGKPEEIYSKLSVEPILRMHLLSLIATLTKNEEELKGFLEKIVKLLKRLEEQRFIVWSGTNLTATRMGRRVAELYLDPETAYRLIQGIGKEMKDFEWLALLSGGREMNAFSVKPSEEAWLVETAEEKGIDAPSPWELEYDSFLASVKTALVLEAWMEEIGEDKMLEDYGVAPGELRGRVENADWLLYACSELALLLGEKEKISNIRKLRARIEYGIREELVPLVRLKGVGRVRARLLFTAGLKTLAKMRAASELDLVRILGQAVGREVYKQLHSAKEMEEKGDLKDFIE